jgi:hypothetical protein
VPSVRSCIPHEVVRPKPWNKRAHRRALTLILHHIDAHVDPWTYVYWYTRTCNPGDQKDRTLSTLVQTYQNSGTTENGMELVRVKMNELHRSDSMIELPNQFMVVELETIISEALYLIAKHWRSCTHKGWSPGQ